MRIKVPRQTSPAAAEPFPGHIGRSRPGMIGHKDVQMQYTLKKESDRQTLVVDATGLINNKVAEKMVMAAGVELKKTGFGKCLFDLTKTVVDPLQTLADMVAFVDVFERSAITPSVRMAALYISGRERRLHLDKAARAAGYTLKHFTDRAKALKWLDQQAVDGA